MTPFLAAGDDTLINLRHVARIEFSERAAGPDGLTRGEWIAFTATGGELGRRCDYASVSKAREYVREIIG